MTEDEAKALERRIRAGVVAHAIRLGKRLKVGEVVDFLIDLREADAADLRAGRVDQAKPISKSHRVAFTVDQADIDAGIRMINEQRAQYREPKLTTIEIEKEPNAE